MKDFPWFSSYPNSVSHDIDFKHYASILDVFKESVEKFAKRPAFSNMGTTFTFEELYIKAQYFAAFLQQELKLAEGTTVGLMMPNILQYPIALYGILMAKMTVVNINPLYTPRELQHQLIDSKCKAIVIFENSAKTLEEILSQTSVKYVVTTQIGDLLSFPKSLIVNTVIKYVKKMVPAWAIANTWEFKDSLALGKLKLSSFVPPKISLEDLAFLQYTGGTTGVSKGAMLTHKNIVANLLQAKEWVKELIVEGKEIIITPLPLYHIFSLTANCMAFASFGALNVLITNPKDISGFIKELNKWKFSCITGVNTLFNALCNHPEIKDVDFSHLKIALGGGMAVQSEVSRKWKELTGKPIVEAYGLTETSPAVCINPLNLEEFNGSIGLPLPSTEVAIKDEEGKTLPIGEAGELCVKGPQVMKGYWNRPEETAKVMTEDHYFRTGDIALFNEKGFVKIVDRKKDMILVSGFNVYPNEIEEVAVLHPNVFEAAAIGVPDEKSGEAVKLFVVKRTPNVTEEEIRAFCKERLTNYKVPKTVEFRDSLPKSNVGKILRKELRA